jgi:hypothetical protein
VETGFCSFTAQFHANSNHRAKKASFVEMPKPGEAKAAMKSLNGKVVDGCKLRKDGILTVPAMPEKPVPNGTRAG